MKKKDLEKLERWWDYNDLEFDYIYISPTRKKYNWYISAYYIGKIWDEIKLLDIYDCGSIFIEVKDNNFLLNWDFEDIYWWIKFWRDWWKLKYEHWWRITPFKKIIDIN